MAKRIEYKYLDRLHPRSRLRYFRDAGSRAQRTGKKVRLAEFICDCGRRKVLTIDVVKRGTTKSCGCYQKEYMADRSTKHGMNNSPEYVTWNSMLQRCTNPKSVGYPRYGGAGVTVCDRWVESFEEFYKDMGSRPTPKHSIDRIDSREGYTPENCRWATDIQQMQNTRASKRWFINGIRYKSLREASNAIGVSDATVMRWCDGHVVDGKKLSAKKDCWSEVVYQKT